MLLAQPPRASIPLSDSNISTPRTLRRFQTTQHHIQHSSGQLSIGQVDRLIAATTEKYLSPEALLNYLNSAKHTVCLVDQPSATTAQAYAQVCTHLWQFLFHALPAHALVTQVQRLSFVWASDKYRAPESPFFATSVLEGSMGTKAVQTRLRSPAVQSALNLATQQLLEDSSRGQTTTSLQSHLSSWAYLCGCSMYQLLQWNHQLTPNLLRALFS